jgi:hypothetical protein
MPDPPKAAEYTRRAAQPKAAINRFCWSASYKWYVDFNLRTGRDSDELTLAGTAPLFFSVASAERAPEIARCLRTIGRRPRIHADCNSPSCTSHAIAAPSGQNRPWAHWQESSFESN